MYKCTMKDLWCPNKNDDQVCHADIDLACSAQICIEDEVKMDRISQMQYDNLRKCFKENLIHPILGKNYYNTAMDVYSCDEETTKHLKRKFDGMKIDMEFYKMLFKISLVINGLFVLVRLLG